MCNQTFRVGEAQEVPCEICLGISQDDKMYRKQITPLRAKTRPVLGLHKLKECIIQVSMNYGSNNELNPFIGPLSIIDALLLTLDTHW